MPNELNETLPTSTPEAFDAPVSIDTPVAVATPTPEPAASTAVETTPPAEPSVASVVREESVEDKLLKFMKGETDEDPSAPATNPDGSPVEPVVVKPVITQTPPKAGRPPGPSRDYNGLSDDEKKMFQNMSAQAYEKLRPIWDNHRKFTEREKVVAEREAKVKDAMPKGVFDDEQAFVLSPQYREAAQGEQMFRFESDYWSKQLSAIEKGEDWKPLMINDKGQYVEGVATAATPENKSLVLRNFTLATNQHAIHSQRVQEVSGKFQSRRSELVQGIKAYEKKFFPFFEGDNNPHRATINQFMQAIPEEFRDHPLSEGYAKAMLALKLVHANSQELSRQLAARQTATVDKAKAGPTLSRTNGALNVKPGGTTDPTQMTPAQLMEFMKGDG